MNKILGSNLDIWLDRVALLAEEDNIEELGIDKFNIGITDGRLCLALLFIVLYRRTSTGKYKFIAQKQINRSLEILEDHPKLINNLGLYNGFSGLIYILSDLYKNEGLYKNALLFLASEHEKVVYGQYLNYSDRQSLPLDSYDLISGLVGIGLSRLKYSASTTNKDSLLHHIITILCKHSNKEKPFITMRRDYNEWDLVTYNAFDGIINLGMAHGIMGVISLISKYQQVYNDKNTIQSQNKLCDLAMKGVLEVNHEIEYANCLVEKEGHLKRDRQYRGVSWCYGNVGAAIGFRRATQTGYSNPRVNEILYSLMDRKSSHLSKYTAGTTMCHGVSGIARTAKSMDNDEIYNEMIEFISEVFNHSDSMGGFFDVRNSNGIRSVHKSISSLDGSIGPAISLILDGTSIASPLDEIMLIT
ncbi:MULTISPECIES: lanthionine synthetase LanC family protein [Deinococcus]|uniref:Lanthionine synthetase LanC family protein n=1 Tax=Deinococcus rufus TaxID=2136097 RepID=A0ABV7Z6G4_9DEIO|nr:lanthionine synthetase LanC family protein [Deinococcus sp. AB2017081]WQE97180.1 lanthionine synthetase LanC family protein [Deinococcus sp. AB2017081]